MRVRVQDSLGYVQPDWVYSETVEVFNNQPPSAPGSIRAENVVSGKYATITITSATDSDGYIAEYIYERSVDGGSWSQAARSGSLSYMDLIDADWQQCNTGRAQLTITARKARMPRLKHSR